MKKHIANYLILVLIMTGNLYAQQKRIYLANDDHTDFMWTANEAVYDSAFVHMLDYYLEKIDSTKTNPDDFQARFNCDGSYWMQAYQKYRTPKQFERLISAIKSGHISVPLHALINCYGGMPTEAAIRGMYYAGQMERKYDLRFRMAGSMENNTIPLGMSSIWAGSGAKYSWYGIGGYGSQMSYEYRADRRHQLYNYTGLDGSSVLMKWYIYDERKTAPLGGYAETRTAIPSKNAVKEISSMIPRLDAMCDTISPNSKYPFNAAAAFGYGHDDLETYLSPEFIQVAKSGTTLTRKVRVSVLEDFFKDIEKNYPKLPSESVTYGNEWDILTASMNETTAKMRRSTEKLRGAEAMATVVSLKNPHFADKLIDMRNKAWDAFGYYWEHDWTGDSKVAMKERPAWQINQQKNLSTYADTLQNLSAKLLGNQIGQSVNPRFFVFNSLSWSRNDVADLEWKGEYPVKVVDLQAKMEVASQLITKGEKKFIRIYAENIPSVGYKVFEIKKEKPAEFPSVIIVSGETISNSFYSLRLSRSGAITGITDKRANNRQLVKFIEGRYLNDLGSGDVESGKPIEVENAGPISVTLKANSDFPVKHTVRVTLYANSPRIEIENSIDANFGDVKTWAFSFDLNNPTTRHEELGAVITAKTETNGGNYSSQNARYDWQTFNHFANMSESDYGVTVSNLDCSFFKLGRSSVYTLDENASQLSALAGGRVDKKWEDGGFLGFPNQNGETNFQYHFALSTHQTSFDAVGSMKFSLEHQNPLLTGEVSGGKSASKQNEYSLLTVSDPNVLLWSVKPSEEGIENGVIVRAWNMGSSKSNPEIKLSHNIGSAWKTTHIETNEKLLNPINGKLSVSFNPYQMNTYRLKIK
ncbi:MAG: glycoside hydrolase [Paludibacter sp.]|nr:glycoside hydrolase [Paludibacter sp.]